MSEGKEERVDKKDFSMYEGKTPEEWASLAGAGEYIKFLKKAEKEGRVKDLTPVQKEDLQKLKAYEMQKGASEENEAEVVESAISWGELKQPRTVAFYLGFPKWYFWIPFEKNMKNFVDREFKTKSILRISIDAQKKYDKQHGIDKRGSNKNKSEDQVKEEPSSKPKKRSLWIRFVEFTKDRNQKELEREARNRVSNSREAPVKEENLENDLSDKLKDANLELGEDE